MANFMGYIENKGQYFNLCLTHIITGKYINELTDAEFDFYLPDSTYRKIVLTYNLSTELSFMENHFHAGEFFVVSFETEDLEMNDSATGKKSYRYNAREAMQNNKLCSITEKGICLYVAKHNADVSTMEKGYMVVSVPFKGEKTKAYIEVDDNKVIGPCVINRRAYDNALVAKINSVGNSRVVESYFRDAFKMINVWNAIDEQEIALCVLKDNAQKNSTDLLSDTELVEGFRDSLREVSLGSEGVNFENIDSLISHYKNSILTSNISNEVREQRLNRLKEILTAETDVVETLNIVADTLCELLIKYQNNDKVSELLEVLISNNPNFIDQIQNARIVQAEIIKLQQTRNDLEEQIKNVSVQTLAQREEEKRGLLTELDKEYEKRLDEYKALMECLEQVKTVSDLKTYQNRLEGEVQYLERQTGRLKNDARDLQTQFTSVINGYHDKMVDIAFDGFMSSKMLDAASKWNQDESERVYYEMAENINMSEHIVDMPPEELVDYICKCVKTERPHYEDNTIINIAICMTQSFLTVFSGEPGCGKTSICNLMGKVLGLDGKKEGQISGSRYVPVSVERGWTSKRDFVGYYNPLSKTFDKSNAAVYDGLKILDIEAENKWTKVPFIVLLDEANLSPMEYYWADFMNICDDLSSNSFINLGEGNLFTIPETLHFVATINNDHTTEVLSPRLVDRAFIITLPSDFGGEFGSKFDWQEIKCIGWNSLKEAFIPNEKDIVLSPEAKAVYDKVISYMRNKMRISISPRTEKAMQKYCVIAEKRFKRDEINNIDTSIIALDYAVSQKLLPKITGNGVEDENKLTELESLLSVSNLEMSSKIVSNIIERGNRQMKYYQFFG